MKNGSFFHLRYPLLVLALVVGRAGKAQTVGVGTTSPHPSAALEINSSNKGLLLPRLTRVQRQAVVNPAPGLMVYQTGNAALASDSVGLWVFGTGARWQFVPDAAARSNSTAALNYVLVRSTASYPASNYFVNQSAGWTTVPLSPSAQTAHVTDGWFFDAGTQSFTCPASGLYTVSYSLQTVSPINGALVSARLTVNGTVQPLTLAQAETRALANPGFAYYPGVGFFTAGAPVQLTAVIPLGAGDAVRLQLYNASTVAPASLLTPPGSLAPDAHSVQLTIAPLGGVGGAGSTQTLSLTGQTLSISGGNSVTLPPSTDNQQLTKTGALISLTNGGAVIDADNQTLNLSGQTLSLSGGNTVTLPAGADNLGNHLATQSLNLGTNLLTGGGATGVGVNAAGGVLLHTTMGNNVPRPAVGTARLAGELSAVGTAGGSSSSLSADDGLLRLSAGGGSNPGTKSFIDLSGFSVNSDLNRSIVLGTSGVERVRISPDGLVGVGTNAPTARLDVRGGGIRVYTSNTGGTADAADWFSAFGGQGGVAMHRVVMGTLFGTATVGGHDFTSANSVGPNGWVNLALNPGGGNVGIGTSSPAATLHVGGSTSAIRFDGLAGTGTRMLTTTANGTLGAAPLPTDAQTLALIGQSLAISGGNTVTLPPGADNLGNHTATQAINLANQPLLGSATATTPITGLTLTSTGQVRVSSTNAGTGTTNWIGLNVGGASGDRVVMGLHDSIPTIGSHNQTLSAWRSLLINPGGRVGVGVSRATANFDVGGTVRFRNLAGTGIRVVTTDAAGVLATVATAALADNLGNHTASQNINLGANLLTGGGSTGVSINASGQVGIGTANPQARLDVEALTPGSAALDVVISPGSSAIVNTNRLWQSLTTTRTGLLYRLDLGVFTLGNPEPATLEIFSGVGTGGALLYSEALTVSGGSAVQWRAFPLRNGVPVVAGQAYTISLSMPTQNILWNRAGSNYAGGTSSWPSGDDLVLSTYVTSSAAPVFTVAENGNVGIGLATPTAALQVAAGEVRLPGGTNPGSLTTHFNFVGDGQNYLRGTTILADNGGNVGIGTASPGSKLHVNGSAYVNGQLTVTSTVSFCGGAYTCSDRRYKRDITPLQSALANVLQLSGYTYFWKREEFKEKAFTADRQIGFIAQEVEAFYPEMVLTDPKTGYKSVDYAKMTPVLLEAIKEQQAQIEALKAEVGHVRAEAAGARTESTAALQTIEARLRALEAGGGQARK